MTVTLAGGKKRGVLLQVCSLASRSSASDSDCDDGERSHMQNADGGTSPAVRFQDAVHRVMGNIAKERTDRVSVNAVALRAKRRFGTEVHALQDRDEAEFLGAVLHSVPILLKETVWMRQVHRALQRMRRTMDPTAAMGAACDGFFKVKSITARACWLTHLLPLREHNRQLEERYSSLKVQFRKVREEYLHEVTALRDQLRMRPDPERGLDQGDVTLFYDPASSLSEDELVFACKAVREKLKMIFEHVPGQPGLNLGQLASMEARAEGRTARELTATVARLLKENEELRQQLYAVQAAVSSAAKAPCSGTLKASEAMVAALQAKVEQLREQCRGERDQEEAEALRQELLEARRGCQAEAARGAALEQRLLGAAAAAASAEALRQAATAEHAELVGQLRGELSRLRAALDLALAPASAEGEGQAAAPGAGAQLEEARGAPWCSVARGLLGQPPLELDLEEPGLGLGGQGAPLGVFREEARARRCAELELQNAELRERCDTLLASLAEMQQGPSSCSVQPSSQREADLATGGGSGTSAAPVVGCWLEAAAEAGAQGEAGAAVDGEAAAAVLRAETGAAAYGLLAELARLRACTPELGVELGLLQSDMASAGLGHLKVLQELALLAGEVLLEASGHAGGASGGRPASSASCGQDLRALVQRMTTHCQGLTQKVEDATAMSLHLSQAVGDLQSQALATAATLKASEAVQQDPTLKAQVSRLEECGHADIFVQAGERMQKQAVFQRLFVKGVSETWRHRREQLKVENLDRWLPTVKLAREEGELEEEAKTVPALLASAVELKSRLVPSQGATAQAPLASDEEEGASEVGRKATTPERSPSPSGSDLGEWPRPASAGACPLPLAAGLPPMPRARPSMRLVAAPGAARRPGSPRGVWRGTAAAPRAHVAPEVGAAGGPSPGRVKSTPRQLGLPLASEDGSLEGGIEWSRETSPEASIIDLNEGFRVSHTKGSHEGPRRHMRAADLLALASSRGPSVPDVVVAAGQLQGMLRRSNGPRTQLPVMLPHPPGAAACGTAASSHTPSECGMVPEVKGTPAAQPLRRPSSLSAQACPKGLAVCGRQHEEHKELPPRELPKPPPLPAARKPSDLPLRGRKTE